jgi:hypothetical protein
MSTSVKWGAERSTPGPKGSLALADGRILVPGRADRSDSRLVCFESSDEGKSWIQLGTIALDPLPNADVGDGNIVRDRKGTLYAAYRHNRHGRDIKTPNYSVKVSVSEDGGRNWNAHSTVTTSNPSEGPSRGLWAPFLFVRNDGAIQCYYDDEDTPFRRGFSGHQWVMMKTLDPKRKGWGEAVTVSRAHDRTRLSRDGMPSVLQVGRTRLLCAFESVQTKPPHAGLVRTVTSEDGGKTWSWLRREREVLYEPKNTRYHAFAPSLTKLPNGELLALIATNEDRPEARDLRNSAAGPLPRYQIPLQLKPWDGMGEVGKAPSQRRSGKLPTLGG